ncbi:hypothetical protein FOFC_17838 [Fusarium oxysporum]|nr:hypothetical protein FOFC_17838 [Fusarium oxysporum]
MQTLNAVTYNLLVEMADRKGFMHILKDRHGLVGYCGQ